MKKRYVVKLTSGERERLEGLVNRGRKAAYRRRHAQALLLVDEGGHGPGLFDKDAAERTGFSRRMVEQIGERCVTEGYACWTLQRLADRLVELNIVDSASHECVHQV